jgi:alkylhydroperoxidase/carboxymuconolactone decarboxylase family protein YurZ
VWARPDLDRRTRSLLTIALHAAFGPDELDVHLRAAPGLGVTEEEIAETLLHVATYAGFPAASYGYRRVEALLGPGDDHG